MPASPRQAQRVTTRRSDRAVGGVPSVEAIVRDRRAVRGDRTS
jgi:hypothetical protein